MLRFEGRVVVVTGAGAGLGRTYAKLFAARGASVVVNDLGGSTHGEGKGSAAADAVVAEIRQQGGKAVANYDSVENGASLIKTAIDNYGRVDVVVNNAGILRDKSFINMTELDWDLIQRVHLKGAYSVTKAAWPYFRKQKYGRIIVTSSNSGVYGSFGQANYSAAKMGLIGLSNTLSMEGAKYNIGCNVVIPTAGSRLTQTVMPDELIEKLKPDYVTPLVVYLCHDSCADTGGVFEAAAGWFGQLQWYRSEGAVLNGLDTTPEDVRENWAKIKDMATAKHFSKSADATAANVQALDRAASSKSQPKRADANVMNPELARRAVIPPAFFEYTSRDVILYALGVGARATDLKFTFEGDEAFSALPTFAVASGLRSTGLNQVDGVALDMSKVLHGEQYLEVYRPWPTDGKVKNVARVVDILDKGSGALILSNVESFDEKTGEKLALGQYSTFQVGSGGFGGARSSEHEKACVAAPSRPADAVVEQQTSLDQAALYRQGSGDYNPLHIDPQFAALAGFKQPILHGLCSLGFSVRHVLQRYANNDVSRFAAVKTRFSKPVIPGQSLQTEMWREGNRIHFQTKVKETGALALSGAYVDLRDAGSTAPSKSGGGGAALKSRSVFEAMKDRLKSALTADVKGIVLWSITDGGREATQWTVDLNKALLYEGAPNDGAKATVTIIIDDSDMVALSSGNLNPQQAFMSGKLKIRGNMMLLQKLQGLFGDKSKI